MNTFDITKWIKLLRESLAEYLILLEFISSENVFETYIENKYGKDRALEEFPDVIRDAESFRRTFRNSFLRSPLKNVIKRYSNQMIVIIASYIEAMHDEFFHTIFSYDNNLMHDYIKNKETNGYVNINLILKSNSKDEIIEELISIAKNNISNGKLQNICKRIYKNTEHTISNDLINSIQSDILNKRNKIVHEAHNLDIKKEDIEDYFDFTKKYLVELGKACKKIEAPVHDPHNLINDPNKNFLTGMTGPSMSRQG